MPDGGVRGCRWCGGRLPDVTYYYHRAQWYDRETNSYVIGNTYLSCPTCGQNYEVAAPPNDPIEILKRK